MGSTVHLQGEAMCPFVLRIDAEFAVKSVFRSSALLSMLVLCACATDDFVSSSKAPDAQPLELRGEKVAAVVLMKSQDSRRRAEDTLAREITAHGAHGVPMYTLIPDANPANEPATRTALENAGVRGVVVMRPISVDNQVKIKPVTYLDPMYGGYWDGYYGMGSGSPYSSAPVRVGTDIQSTTTVYVESLVYSLKQNKLVWSGQSKTVDPPKLDEFVRQLAAEVAKQLQSQGLMQK
jgi:hypothetical protein